MAQQDPRLHEDEEWDSSSGDEGESPLTAAEKEELRAMAAASATADHGAEQQVKVLEKFRRREKMVQAARSRLAGALSRGEAAPAVGNLEDGFWALYSVEYARRFHRRNHMEWEIDFIDDEVTVHIPPAGFHMFPRCDIPDRAGLEGVTIRTGGGGGGGGEGEGEGEKVVEARVVFLGEGYLTFEMRLGDLLDEKSGGGEAGEETVTFYGIFRREEDIEFDVPDDEVMASLQEQIRAGEGEDSHMEG